MPQDECIQQVLAASALEHEGIELDRAGDNEGAILKYEECMRGLGAAIAAALPDHAEDKPKLEQHRTEICDRIAHLKSMKGQPASIPVEDQIRAVQLGMQATQAASAAVGQAGGVKTIGACAAMGAGAAFVVLGSTVGAPIALIGGAAGAAYLATRGDKAGDAARGVGGAGLAVAGKAKELNDKHGVTDKAIDLTKGVVSKAREADTKYGITTKIGQGVGVAMAKASEIEQKHHVTDKVAGGISAGMGRLSQALSGSGSARGSASGSGA